MISRWVCFLATQATYTVYKQKKDKITISVNNLAFRFLSNKLPRYILDNIWLAGGRWRGGGRVIMILLAFSSHPMYWKQVMNFLSLDMLDACIFF